MTIHATNGTKIYIGSVMLPEIDDLTEADFTGETWVEIGETEGLGSVGDTANEITADLINRGRTFRAKGTRNAGTMEIVCALDPTDPGQVAVVAAEKTRNNYAFRIEFPDAPSGGTGTTRYFIALVGSAVEALDAANNVMKLNTSLWVNSNVVRVAASPSTP